MAQVVKPKVLDTGSL